MHRECESVILLYIFEQAVNPTLRKIAQVTDETEMELGLASAGMVRGSPGINDHCKHERAECRATPTFGDSSKSELAASLS
jgi:hypothetical protein